MFYLRFLRENRLMPKAVLAVLIITGDARIYNTSLSVYSLPVPIREDVYILSEHINSKTPCAAESGSSVFGSNISTEPTSESPNNTARYNRMQIPIFFDKAAINVTIAAIAK